MRLPDQFLPFRKKDNYGLEASNLIRHFALSKTLTFPRFRIKLFVALFLALFLIATEARAEIVGPTLKYLTPRSTLKLICKVLQSTEATAYIFWYHDNRMINYDLDRGINVSSEAGKGAGVMAH